MVCGSGFRIRRLGFRVYAGLGFRVSSAHGFRFQRVVYAFKAKGVEHLGLLVQEVF